MAWEMLRVNYTDAVWSGLKRYEPITNDDGTVSFRDVTDYSNKDNSFFGAKDANRMNEAMNSIMCMLENGTDLYTAFVEYFALQKQLFELNANYTMNNFRTYTDNLKAEGDDIIDTLRTDYRKELDTFESEQEALYKTWFAHMRDQLSEDAAGNLQNQVDDVNLKTQGVYNSRISFHEDGTITERWGDNLENRTMTYFLPDGRIVQHFYINGSRSHTKTITFESDGTIKEDIA